MRSGVVKAVSRCCFVSAGLAFGLQTRVGRRSATAAMLVSGWFKQRSMILIWAIIRMRSKRCSRPSRKDTVRNAEAFFWLGRSYYELRDFDNAVVHAEKAVAWTTKTPYTINGWAAPTAGRPTATGAFFSPRR